MNLEQQILQTFSSQFVCYYKAHNFHWNIQGPNFYSNHKLLKHIYKDLFKENDNLAEIIRTLDIEIPVTLGTIISLSEVVDTDVYDDQDGDEYLTNLRDDLMVLTQAFQELEQVTDDLAHSQIQNYCQDRIKSIERFIWMIKSTLAQKFNV
jgi:starvation-inducible DNA-binding protein